jgi:GTP pyrophosphokinase
MVRLNEILDKVLSYYPEADVSLIKKAFVFSAKVHKGQVRKSGQPYLIHPLAVSNILAELKLDPVTVAVGLLHDTVEDTGTTHDQIEELFGKEISDLVDGLTHLGRLPEWTTEELQAENYRKMILAMGRDIRVILVKLADRLHNMRTLEYMPDDKQAKIARETMDIYAPLANRLGIGRIKSELEDRSFEYLLPEVFVEIKSKVAREQKERIKIIEESKKTIQDNFRRIFLKARIDGRPKHFYSIYQKMERKGVEFEKITDVVGLRIITSSIPDCYAALGVIHSLWPPIPGEFDDYIALPKPNGYQSLHTAVMASNGPLEIQIRTDKMHQIAERGIASHWRYKEKLDKELDRKFVWLRELVELHKNLQDPREFIRNVKADLFPDEVYVFTPKGQVKCFPKGSVPIDFAYMIHTEIGHQCIGARINNRLVPLRTPLKNGDIVDIITSSSHTPSRDWLKVVKTSKARTAVKHWIKVEERQRSISLGKEIAFREMRRYGLSPNKLEKKGELKKAAQQLGFGEIDDLMAGIGYGKVSSKSLIGKFLHEDKLEEPQDVSRLAKVKRSLLGLDKRVKIRGGVGDVMVGFGKCCTPVIGDSIIGFITRGRGITVHRESCPNAHALMTDPERIIDVRWDTAKSHVQPVGIKVISGTRPGLLAEISGAISRSKTNILKAIAHTHEDQKATHQFLVEVKNVKQLKRLMKSIQQIKDVIKVERVKASGFVEGKLPG